MEKLVNVESTTKKEKLWAKLADYSKPHVINVFTGEIGFIMPYMKVTIEGGELNAVYTDSNLYPDITDQDIDTILKDGVLEGIRKIAYTRSWSKLKALREHLYLNKSRGAFKKYKEKELEITQLISKMRQLKHTNKLILNS